MIAVVISRPRPSFGEPGPRPEMGHGRREVFPARRHARADSAALSCPVPSPKIPPPWNFRVTPGTAGRHLLADQGIVSV